MILKILQEIFQLEEIGECEQIFPITVHIRKAAKLVTTMQAPVGTGR